MQEGAAFGGVKETRVRWIGNEDKILATGVSKVKNDDISYKVFDWLVGFIRHIGLVNGYRSET